MKRNQMLKRVKVLLSVLLAITTVIGMILPASAASHPFTDVSDNAWYAENVEYVYAHGLMNGTDADKFSPEEKMNRAMLVTVLYRMDGSNKTSGTTPFTDISATGYYYDALVWAYTNGIINGTDVDKFSPEQPITREMLVTIFYRYAGHKGYAVNKLANLSAYTDAGAISNYAVTAFQWSVEAGIVGGTSNTTLSPTDTATRAQCAAILQRFCEWAKNTTDPSEPDNPTDPTVPTDPSKPTEPSDPTDPTEPSEPTEHEHTYEGKVTKEPTCVDTGIKTYTCTSCGDNYTEEIPATGIHTYKTYETLKEANCIEDGKIKYTCDVCGGTFTEVVPALGHDLVTTEHEEKGHYETMLTCRCGWVCYNYEADDFGMIEPEYHMDYHTSFFLASELVDTNLSVLHSYKNGHYFVVDEPAYTEVTCSREGCDYHTHTHGYVLTERSKVIHPGEEGYCTEERHETYTCVVCGDSYTVDIEAPGHDYHIVHHEEVGHHLLQITCSCGWTATSDEAKAAGYDELFDYYHETHIMSLPFEEVRDPDLHTFEETSLGWVVDVPAYDETCCRYCGEEWVPDHEHEFVYTGTYAPSCYGQGSDRYVCSVCGMVFCDNYVPQLRHKMVYFEEKHRWECVNDGCTYYENHKADCTGEFVCKHRDAFGAEPAYDEWTCTGCDYYRKDYNCIHGD